MAESLPAILYLSNGETLHALIDKETILLSHQARKLFDAGFYDYSLLDVWNAVISNLRRSIEAYSVGLFLPHGGDQVMICEKYQD
jgi:hypothetical protein